MSKTGSAAKVKLNSFDDLFGNNEMQTAGSEQIINAPLSMPVQMWGNISDLS